jgi:hypothetical protein
MRIILIYILQNRLGGACTDDQAEGREKWRAVMKVEEVEGEGGTILLFHHYGPLYLACSSFFGISQNCAPLPQTGGSGFDFGVSKLPWNFSYPLFVGHTPYGRPWGGVVVKALRC